MSSFAKRILLCVMAVASFFTATAQKVSFEANAPGAVAAGDAFRVEFTISNATPEGFNTPDFTGFDVIAGPSIAEGTTVNITNGNMVQNKSVTYSFVLQAKEEGQFTIPAVSIKADGKTYTSQPIRIEVIKENTHGGNPSGNISGGDGAATSNNAKIADDDILLVVSAGKTKAYRGQAVRIVFKLYTRVPLSGVENTKTPAFNGFWVQELDTGSYSWQRESYKGKLYESRIIREYLLFPQQSGALQIEPYDITAIAQVITQRQRRSLMDDFFGGGNDVKEVRKRISSAPVRINVTDLPAGSPAGFTGAVGDFSMTSELPNTSLTANSSLTYTIKISGTGNMPLIQAPKIAMPSSFEQYNVKTTESLNKTSGGISGYKQFEFPFIARAEGDYTIPPVSFSYFNPDSEKYVTLSTKELNMHILPDSTGRGSVSGGLVSGLTKEDIQILGQDIRFIKIGSNGLKPSGSFFIFSPLFVIIALFIIALFIFMLVFIQKRIKHLGNFEAVREKKANKVALARLKAAEEFMNKGDSRHFHDEMLKALWGYMGDKLNIPAAGLTKERVRDGVMKRHISVEQANKYIELISQCEYAQYSPVESQAMPDVFRAAVSSISYMESHIKR